MMELIKKNDLVYVLNYKNNLKLCVLSDVHWDSRKCDRDLLKKHFDYAVKNNAMIVLNGDWFDAMGCKKDFRSIKGDIRPEYNVANYLDAITEDSFEFLKKYSDNLLLVLHGNHETAMTKHHETNILRNLVKMIQLDNKNSKVELAGYQAFLKLRRKNEETKLIHFHHGFGGAAPRSKGVLKVDMDCANYPNVDIFVRGHDHNKWVLPRERVIITKREIVKNRTSYHIQCGSYKKAAVQQPFGWEVEKGFSPQPVGGYEIDLIKEYCKKVEKGKEARIRIKINEL